MARDAARPGPAAHPVAAPGAGSAPAPDRAGPAGAGPADVHGIEIRPLRTHEDFRACVELQRETWGEGFSEAVPPAILWAVQRVGGVAAGAFDAEGRLLGFVFGITGLEEPGRPAHWSDMLAVRAGLRDRGLGERLKRWQREALLALGVPTAYWTFDPLVSRNAYLNFARLGAIAREYLPDLYGDTDSPLHRGIGTDRLVAAWELETDRVRRRLERRDRLPEAADVAAIPLANPVRPGAAGPECDEPDLALDEPAVRIAIPADVHAIAADAPELAADWRRKTRAAFQEYLGRGFAAWELVREGQDRSSYVLGLRPFAW